MSNINVKLESTPFMPENNIKAAEKVQEKDNDKNNNKSSKK